MELSKLIERTLIIGALGRCECRSVDCVRENAKTLVEFVRWEILPCFTCNNCRRCLLTRVKASIGQSCTCKCTSIWFMMVTRLRPTRPGMGCAMNTFSSTCKLSPLNPCYDKTHTVSTQPTAYLPTSALLCPRSCGTLSCSTEISHTTLVPPVHENESWHGNK